jgi:outer membrane protein OmpA-like peptidoglycan-associated protein
MEFTMTKFALALIATALVTTGCATKDYVHEYVDGQVKPVNKRMDGVEGRVSANEAAAQAGIQELNRRADGNEVALKDHAASIEGASRMAQEASTTAKEALDRAKLAGKLAEGKLIHEVVMSDDSLQFALEGNELSKEAKQQLDAFADKLKAENRNVYIEIQGHTDASGGEAYNLMLGEKRAEMVRRYLNMKGGIPLHRMASISYGETAPVASNKTRAGRAQNRRVVLVVLN